MRYAPVKEHGITFLKQDLVPVKIKNNHPGNNVLILKSLRPDQRPAGILVQLQQHHIQAHILYRSGKNPVIMKPILQLLFKKLVFIPPLNKKTCPLKSKTTIPETSYLYSKSAVRTSGLLASWSSSSNTISRTTFFTDLEKIR